MCETGETETTHTPQEVKASEQISIWDVPGGGTAAHPAETYIKDFGLKAFDTVILVSADRFSQFSVDLHRILTAAGVPVFLVRNKADIAFKSVMDRHNVDQDTARCDADEAAA